MNYFEYKGIRSSDMGLRIESKNVFSAPKYDVDFLEIPGRDGDLIAGNGRFSWLKAPCREHRQLRRCICLVQSDCSLSG